MEIILENVYSYFSGYDEYPEELKRTLEYTASFFVQGANFSHQYKTGKWDGRNYLLNSGGRFPTGLAGMLFDVAKKAGYVMKVTDKTQRVAGARWEWTGPELRDYQVEAVAAAIKTGRGLIELPTRTGKTFAAGKIIQQLGLRTLYLVNGKESMYQTYADLEECIDGPTWGYYGDGHKDTDADITIALIQSLMRVKGTNPFKNAQVIFLDEVHKAGADSIYNFFMKVPAPYRYGMSGTVFRADNKDIKMVALTGRIIYQKEQEEMWDAGVIERPKIYWVSVPNERLHRGMGYRMHYTLGVVRNDVRNQKIGAILKKHHGAQILISVENIEHGEILEKMYRSDGAIFVNGLSDKEMRQQVYADMQSGITKVVIATRIFNESLTFADLAVLVNAAGRKSAVELLQKYGRVQGKGNKGQVVIYDFKDEHSYYLEKHAHRRRAELKGRGYEQIEYKEES